MKVAISSIRDSFLWYSSSPLVHNITDVFIYVGDCRSCSISGNCACIINNVTDIELSHGIAYVYMIKEFEICS